MNKDKTVGRWMEGASELDDMAYYLYCLFEINKNSNHIYYLITQQSFISFKYEGSELFYNKAKIQLRRMKIEKLKKC